MAESELTPLGPVDSAFYYVESRETPMNIGALTIFDGKIPFEYFSRMVDAKLYQSPIYLKKIIHTPLNLSEPAWVFDPDFFVGNHIFHKVLPAPGTEEQLRVFAGQIVSSPLDRKKPLWEVHLIDGLEGDRTAILFKVHHCMVDGLAAIDLLTMIFDLTPDTPPLPKKPLYDPPRLPKNSELLFGALGRNISYKLSILGKLGHDIGYVGQLLGDKDKRRRLFMGVAGLISDNLKPIKKLPINGRNSGRQALAWAEFSLAEVRAIKSNHRASVNDVMLTVLANAIESYVQARDSGPSLTSNDPLRVLVPVNVREEGEKGRHGNRISVIPVDIPFKNTDPLARLEQVAENTNILKHSAISQGLDLVLTLPSLAFAPFQPLLWGLAPVLFSLLAHTWCTNVSGPQFPVYIAGRKLIHSYGYFPLNPSMGLACVVMSYNQRITMTLIADTGIIPDVTELGRYLREAYVALRKAANVPEIAPVVIERVRSAETTAPEALEVDTTNGSKPQAEPARGTPPLEPTLHTPAAPTQEVHLVVAPEARVEAVAAEPAPEPARAIVPHVELKPRLFSEEWARAYREAINTNPNYRSASLNWEAGPLAFVIRASVRDGFPRPAAVIMDLYRGECRSARSLTPDEAYTEAAFVIEGDYNTWMRVLSGRDQPLMLLMRGKLQLRKGSTAKLLPFARSAQELVRSAQRLS